MDTSKQVPLYKSSFESVLEAAISKTAETWENFPRLTKANRKESFIQNTPFLKSNFMTPKKKSLNVSFEK